MTGAASVRAVLLDAAGTLLTVATPVGETYGHVAARFGATLDAEALAAGFRTVFPQMPPLAFPPSDAASLDTRERGWWRTLVRRVTDEAGGVARFDEFFDALYAHYADPTAWRLYPETLAVLDALRAREMRLAVVSNFDSRLPKLLVALGVAERVDAVVYSGAAGAAKPDPAIFEHALALLGVPAHAALHVGDNRRADFDGARAAGLGALLVDRHAPGEVEDRVSTLDAILHHI